jgi:serine phosphatase RsbU (regulator of sigma subunit)
MTTNETVALQRLLDRAQAGAMLQNFSSALPGLALAIFRADGKLLASTDNWNLNPETLGEPAGVLATREYPLDVKGTVVGKLVAQGQSASRFNPLERAVQQSINAFISQSLERRQMANEALDRYREINLMYRISETIGALLDVEKIPAKVLEESQHALRADSAVVLLSPSDGDANWTIKASFGNDESRVVVETVRTALGVSWQSDRPAILTELSNPAFGAMLWAPLKGKASVLGALVLARAAGQPIFTASDEKLMMALAGQAAISVENARLHQQVLEKERLEHELQLAREVQARLIPGETPIIPGWDFAAYWQPAREVSGDFYDFIPGVGGSGSSALGIVIADVSDKGMHAALFMALTRSIVRASTTAGLSPSEGLTQTNRLLCQDSTNGMFVTLFYSQLDPQKNELIYVNAGHNPPLHYHAREEELAELKATGIMMGFTDQVVHKQRSVELQPNDFVVYYTDGVTEAMNEVNEQFSDERLREVVLAQRNSSPQEMMRAIQHSLTAFVGNRAQSDDITVVILKRVAV